MCDVCEIASADIKIRHSNNDYLLCTPCYTISILAKKCFWIFVGILILLSQSNNIFVIFTILFIISIIALKLFFNKQLYLDYQLVIDLVYNYLKWIYIFLTVDRLLEGRKVSIQYFRSTPLDW